MCQRSTMRFRPGLEQFEEKQLLSAGSLTTHAGPQTKDLRRQPAPVGTFGYLAFRVTNTPWQTPYKLVPPFQQVLVQSRQPVPGQVYNVNAVTVKNGTSQTFTASNGFTVRMTNQPRSFGGFPILTGNEQWKPGQMTRLLRSDQEVLSGVLRRRGFPARPRRQVINTRTGTIGDFSQAQIQSCHVRPHSQLDRCLWPGQPGGQGREIWSAQHINQRDRRRENPPD